jgi:hypothetical protein
VWCGHDEGELSLDHARTRRRHRWDAREGVKVLATGARERRGCPSGPALTAEQIFDLRTWFLEVQGRRLGLECFEFGDPFGAKEVRPGGLGGDWQGARQRKQCSGTSHL